MTKPVKIKDKTIAPGNPVFITAEIGINHNRDINIAKRLIDYAVDAGCDAVKFQKRSPNRCVPDSQRNIMRETPWGYIPYIDYRYKIEFGFDEYQQIDQYCKEKGIIWFVSCWDIEALDFMESFDPPCYKIPSACLTDHKLLKEFKSKGRVLILSTGMSTMDQITNAVKLLGNENLIILHCTSTYPCPPSELNLKMITTLQKKFDCPVGYSGHEVGLPTTLASVALGAVFVERHITLDRSMWGSDQAASVEPQGLVRLVKYIRVIEEGLGDGHKRVYDSEASLIKRLRRI